MGELKPGWKRVKFGEVVRLCRETCKDPSAEGIDRVIGLEHLEPGDLRVRSWADLADGTTFTQRVRPGQVLFGKRRAYQRKVAVADFDAICSGDIYVFESADPKRLLPALLPFLCQTDAFFEHAVGTSAGSLSPRTNWSSLAAYEFALPPSKEQTRAAALLASVRASSDALHEAVVAAQRTETALVEDFINRTRQREKIGQHVSDISYGCSLKSTSERQGTPMLRIPNVLRGDLDLGDLQWIELGEAERAQFEVRPSDILLVRTNGNPDYVGRSVVVPEGTPPMAFASYLLRLRVTNSMLPEYLSAMINAPTTRRSLRGSIRSSAGNYNVNTTGIREQAVPICSIGEQGLLVEQFRKAKLCREGLQHRASEMAAFRAQVLREVLA